VAGETNGWYVWCGTEFKEDAEFFAQLHTRHLCEDYPEIAKFLGLPPGFRFLFSPEFVDVWFDELLLNV
jgi:hypothetical protein